MLVTGDNEFNRGTIESWYNVEKKEKVALLINT